MNLPPPRAYSTHMKANLMVVDMEPKINILTGFPVLEIEIRNESDLFPMDGDDHAEIAEDERLPFAAALLGVSVEELATYMRLRPVPAPPTEEDQ